MFNGSSAAHEAGLACAALQELSRPNCMQVERELQAERLTAEADERRAKTAIEQQQAELRSIEQQRQHEVCTQPCCATPLAPVRPVGASSPVCTMICPCQNVVQKGYCSTAGALT